MEPERWERQPTGQTVADAWKAKEGDVAARRLMLLEYGIRVRVAPARGRRTWDPGRLDIDVNEEMWARWAWESLVDDATG